MNMVVIVMVMEMMMVTAVMTMKMMEVVWWWWHCGDGGGGTSHADKGVDSGDLRLWDREHRLLSGLPGMIHSGFLVIKFFNSPPHYYLGTSFSETGFLCLALVVLEFTL